MTDAELFEHRQATRYAIAVPVAFDGVNGTTLDLSPCGVRFATAARPAPGDRLELTLRFQTDGVLMRTQARVLRVQPRAGDRAVVEVAAVFEEIVSFAGDPQGRAKSSDIQRGENP